MLNYTVAPSDYTFNVSVSTTCYKTKEEFEKASSRLIYRKQEVSVSSLCGLIKEGHSFCHCYDDNDEPDTVNHISTMGYYILPYQQKVSVTATPKVHSFQSGNDRVVKGVRGLARFLGWGVNKAQQIMNSGVLVESKIAYKIGKTWLMNKEKLTFF